jgi:hypothetical protein
VVGDDLTGPGTPADDQVTQVSGASGTSSTATSRVALNTTALMQASRQVPGRRLRRASPSRPRLAGAAIAVTAVRTGVYGIPAALGAAMACFLIRLAGIRYNINAPIPPEDKSKE